MPLCFWVKGNEVMQGRNALGFLFVEALLLGCPTENDDDTTSVDYCADYDPSAPIPVDWVSIPGGTFEMGSEDGDEDELPIHTVTVPSFEMWRTEVTVAQYAQCYCAGVCFEPYVCVNSNLYHWGKPGYQDYPIGCINWENGTVFCEWAGGRLPSEAEWEYAARSGGQDISYPWGDEQPNCDYAVMPGELDDSGCAEGSTWPVCSKPAGDTEHGLCDMAGNLGEYVEDRYHDSYHGAPSDGSAWGSPDTYGYIAVTRGGAFGSTADQLRVSDRLCAPTGGMETASFRCAR